MGGLSPTMARRQDRLGAWNVVNKKKRKDGWTKRRKRIINWAVNLGVGFFAPDFLTFPRC